MLFSQKVIFFDNTKNTAFASNFIMTLKKRHSPITSHDFRESCDLIGDFLFLWRHDKISRIGIIFDIALVTPKSYRLVCDKIGFLLGSKKLPKWLKEKFEWIFENFFGSMFNFLTKYSWRTHLIYSLRKYEYISGTERSKSTL